MSNYNERYNIDWISKTNQGKIYIDKVDSIVASEQLILAKDGIEINTKFDDWNEPIFKQNAQITIQNDASTVSRFFELLPLMSAEEREYRVRINQTSPSAKKLFEGFLNSDVNEQGYLNRQSIRLVASNYIQKLEYVTPTSIETIQKKSLIDVISETLNLTGKDSSIRVNMNICPSGDTIGTTKTALNLCSLDTEVFWQNNIKKDNGLEILKKTLKPFDSYLYWWDGNWYIERYEDLYKYPQHYVTYRPDISYGYTSTATSVNTYDVSSNFSVSGLFIERSQLISITPGLNKIEIELNDVLYGSLMNSDLSGMTSTAIMWVKDRTWGFNDDPYYHFYKPGEPLYDFGLMSGLGKPFLSMENAAGMYIDMLWQGRPLGPGQGTRLNDYAWQQGVIYTTFKCTVEPPTVANPTVLNLEWKWRPKQQYVETHPPYAGADTFTLRWYLNLTNQLKFVCQDPSLNWYIKNGTEAESFQSFTINYSDLDVKKDYIYTAKIAIPLTDVSGNLLTGDQTFTFALLMPSYHWTNNESYLSDINYWGDIKATTNAASQDNLIKGEINNKFLNKKTIGLDLFDISNLNYKNGIYTGTTSSQRTSLWYDDAGVYLPLEHMLIKNKSQLYYKSRQQISSTVISSDFLKPFSMWYDSNQPEKKYVLTGYSYRPTQNQYDCVWSEYDNTTLVNLNIINS